MDISNDTELSPNSLSAALRKLQAEKDLLQARFDDLRSRYARLEKRAESAAAKAVQYKQHAKRWSLYLQQRCPEVYSKAVSDQAHPASHSSPSLTPRAQDGLAPSEMSRNLSPSVERAIGTNSSEDEILHASTASDAAVTPLDADQVARPAQRSFRRVESSATTIVDPQSSPPIKIKQESRGDSSPVEIGARSLKRKRSIPSSPSIKAEPSSSASAIVIKSETMSSPVLVSALPLLHTDTLDLDVVGQHMDTPRKHREFLVAGQSSFQADDGVGDPHLLAAHDEEQENAENRSHLSSHATKPVSKVTGPRKRRRDQRSPLGSISGNIPRILPRTYSSLSNPGDLLGKINMVSEGGDNQLKPRQDQRKQRRRDPVHTHEIEGRLEEILSKPSPDRRPLSPRQQTRTSPIKQNARRESSVIQAPPIEQCDAPKSASRIKLEPDDVPTVQPSSSTSSKTSLPTASLRQQPLSTLRLDDFKINPTYLNTDHAFSETFRGRDARRNLHICIRPTCCGGALRRAIEIGGPILSGKTDAAALSAYLGASDWARIIAAYDDAKRREVALQAHAFVFASEHGKHRVAFERQASPPGFWRTGMPSTQEMEEDRKQAEVMVRERVEERWREAMREGGRWMFRDE